MLKVLSHPFRAGFKITKLIISLTLFTVHGCQSTQLSLRQGQDTQFNFPYACDSTEVTIQHGYKAPFYRLTDGSSLSLSDEGYSRFKVQNKSENGNCYLELTISNLMRSDAGTYIAVVYKDGQLIVDLTTRVGLQIEYPPGKASCVEEEDKGGGWVAMECTADVGSISGKIECYQNGEKMPSLTDPVETYITLTEIILIKETQPAFCCSSTLDEDKTRCECNDTVLNIQDESSKDPCPMTSLITMMPLIYNVPDTENNLTDFIFAMTTYTSTMMKDDNCKAVIIHSTLFPIEVILLLLSLFVHYKVKTKTRTNHNGHDPPKSSKSLLDSHKRKMKNGSTKENGIV